MQASGVARRKMMDPSALTPMEEKLRALHQRGLSYQEMAAQMGGKWTAKNIGGKLAVIREKLACR